MLDFLVWLYKRSAFETLIVPNQRFPRRPELLQFWQMNRFAFPSVVFISVIELFPDALANLDFVVWCNGDVAAIKKGVDILSEQKAIGRGVSPFLCIGSNVCS